MDPTRAALALGYGGLGCRGDPGFEVFRNGGEVLSVSAICYKRLRLRAVFGLTSGSIWPNPGQVLQ